MVTRAKHLYRPEYFEAQKSNNQGSILIDASLNQNVFVAASAFVLVAIIFFVVFAEYTRRDTLNGVVSPTGGIIKVQANDEGYAGKVFVTEGQKVLAGEPLYDIQTERYDEFGRGVKKRILTTIDSQISLLNERRHKEVEKYQHQLEDIDDDLIRLSEEEDILEVVFDLSKQELSLAQSLVDKQQVLVNKQFISSIELQRQRLELITLESKVQTQRLSLQRLVREKAKLKETKETLQLELDIALQEIDRQLQQIAQNKIEYFYQTDTQIVSPINGVVASIFVKEGHSVNKGQPLLVVIPEGEDPAIVELYAPSRSIGFIQEGQGVRLRFDAFPYEKFGIQQGVIASISKSAVSAEMLPNSPLIQGQLSRTYGGVGLYQVRVKLEKPTITVYGEEQMFVPGMTLTADIELDTRKVYEWLLEPLYTIKGRM
ncbi:HlyD family efflux transporter periplasmic adaptor subunit [Vibrio navarrensis]|uniref:HlyD family efflux transporter periplasmic adaptor subunit n=1 Tax=Vibrio navarrensis TaxID=29495 RepID=A0AAI9CR30_9VIBR|nr:HlyD family efflux transporter periplasmic adaptor subunit [Vibrio navarrensis]EGR2795263.1 HlyD family efflux transporter periplasmic adaptor subunit [Vibrio navarrensis]EJL6400585.1 HlyD family efflux transporter periplasmic adaptor subunit [Vibrio navarrensis]EJL6568049.1 HlyD family efflux transporter periplasmic adaptor subunit [Vibrio navarrensis]ELN6931075.1 HlyD family efflux transporter periplasmic adaptor subunit [Vibrio navarrensis]